jgi:ASC-1-like (ASCH) protein
VETMDSLIYKNSIVHYLKEFEPFRNYLKEVGFDQNLDAYASFNDGLSFYDQYFR